MQSWGTDAIVMRQLQQQLAATSRPSVSRAQPPRRAFARRPHMPARVRVGWALIDVGARLAISGSAASPR